MERLGSSRTDMWAAADEIRELAAHVHAAEARLAEKLADFTADPRWNDGDWRSATHWVTVNCGYAPAEATALARVAEKASAMPEVMERARAGEVSLGVVASAARVATPEIDATLANIVTTATPTQVRRLLSRFRELTPNPAEPDSPETEGSYYWNSWFDERGDWCARGKAPAEIGSLIDEAYEAARRAGEHERRDDDGAAAGEERTRTPIPCSETLRLMGEMVLDSARRDRLTRPGGEPFTVTVLIDLATLVTGTLRVDSTCRFESGPDVTPELVRRLAEEGSLEILWHREGVPLKLGRSFRLANRHQRRALRFRDGGCAVPGCGQTRHVHVHHVVEWADGGHTDLDNELLVCSYHHRLIHHHGWRVQANGDQSFTFFDRHDRVVDNRLVSHTRRDGRPPPGRLEVLSEQRCLDIGPHTAPPLGRGERLTFYAADTWMRALLTAA